MAKKLTRKAFDHAPAPVPVSTPDLSNLEACIQDVIQAANDDDPGPVDPDDFHPLMARLEASRDKTPELYRQKMLTPFVDTLRRLGPTGFAQALGRDPRRVGNSGVMMDVAHSILQNAEGIEALATDAFQELLSDLYDGFLSHQDRADIKVPDFAVSAPLVKWGNPADGPYTWPIEVTHDVLKVEAGVVSLPPANARAGLLAWAALSHESGHDIIGADEGLESEMSLAVWNAVKAATGSEHLATYWSERIGETGADVLGILNLGPAAAIGLIGYFRGLNKAFGGVAGLRQDGPSSDPHPSDLIRAYLGAFAVSRLKFGGAKGWAKAIEAEADKDKRSFLFLGGEGFSLADAKKSAEAVAEVLMNGEFHSLNGNTLADIQNWNDSDESLIRQLRPLLSNGAPLPPTLDENLYAAHVVAAAVVEALSAGRNVSLIFRQMKRLLKQMHDANPSWGPLFAAHPGVMKRHLSFQAAGHGRAQGAGSVDSKEDLEKIVISVIERKLRIAGVTRATSFADDLEIDAQTKEVLFVAIRTAIEDAGATIHGFTSADFAGQETVGDAIDAIADAIPSLG